MSGARAGSVIQAGIDGQEPKSGRPLAGLSPTCYSVNHSWGSSQGGRLKACWVSEANG